MSKKLIEISYTSLSHSNQLKGEDQILFEKAIESMSTAYAPYSKFSVGCTVLLEDGTYVSGSNQENIAYPSGLCAERVALFSAASNHPGVPVKCIAVVAKPLVQNEKLTLTPCGACRQVILEYQRLQSRPIRLISGTKEGEVTILEDATALLPLAFFDSGLSQTKE